MLVLALAALVGLGAGLFALGPARSDLLADALTGGIDGRSAVGLLCSVPIALALAAVAIGRAPIAALLVLPLPLLVGDYLAGRYLEVPFAWLPDPAVEDRSGWIGHVLGAGVRFRVVGGAVSGAMFAALAVLRGRGPDRGARLEALLALLGAALSTASAALARWLTVLTDPDPSVTDPDPTGLAGLLHAEPTAEAVERATATAHALELTHLGAAIAVAAGAVGVAWLLRRDRVAALVAALLLVLPAADVWADAVSREATRARAQPWWWGTPGLEVPVSDASSGDYVSAGATLLESGEIRDAWGRRRDAATLATLLGAAADANARAAEPDEEEEAPPDTDPPSALTADDRAVAVAVDARADASRWRALLEAASASDVRRLCLAVRAASDDGTALAPPAPTGSPWIDALAPTHAAVLCVYTERALADGVGAPFFHVRLRGRAHPAVAAQAGADPTLPDAACPVGPDGEPLPRPPQAPLFAIIDDAMHTGDLIGLARESERLRLPVALVAAAPAAIEAPLERSTPAPDLRGEHSLTEPAWARLYPGPDASPLASVLLAPPPPPLVADTEIFFEVNTRTELAILALAERRAALARCYDEERAHDPDARGALYLHLVTDLAGAPFDAACTRSASLSAEMCRCVEQAAIEGARPAADVDADAQPVHLWFQPYHADRPE